MTSDDEGATWRDMTDEEIDRVECLSHEQDRDDDDEDQDS